MKRCVVGVLMLGFLGCAQGGEGRADSGRRAGDACMAQPETCNSFDDDCDGAIDEDFDLRSDPANCGRCGSTCDLANATGTCDQGACVVRRCADGFGDCDGRSVTGCEVDLGTTEACGRCGMACPAATPLCVPSGATASCAASCPPGAMRCGSACVDVMTSTANCGGCGVPCGGMRRTGVCAAGRCTLGACETGFNDCNGRADDGCETVGSCPVDAGPARDAGSVGVDAGPGRDSGPATCSSGCNGGQVCDVSPGTCSGTMCVYTRRPAGSMCRAIAGPCDAVEVCNGTQSTCPGDGYAPAGTQCRAPACAGDRAETCTGLTLDCPAACGCVGEPCCAGNTCGSTLGCVAGRCRPCSTTAPRVAGSFTTSFDSDVGYGRIVAVDGAGTTLTFRDSLGASEVLTLSGGVTVSGSWSRTCDPDSGCDALDSANASGNRVSLCSRIAGCTGELVFSGATASGSYAAQCDSDGCPQTRSVQGVGAVVRFTDSFNNTGEITLAGVQTCQ